MVPPDQQLQRVVNMLRSELAAASNIKSKSNRNAVVSAINSVMQVLKRFPRTPATGIVVFCGQPLHKGRKIEEVIVPHLPINTSLYLCGSKFNTEVVRSLLAAEDKRFGFIVVGGSGTLFGLLQNNAKTVLKQLSVDLPNKHGRGGQSANRFARLRLEGRHNYILRVCEAAAQLFVKND